MSDSLVISQRQELSAEERELPLARYFDLPLLLPGPREQELIDLMPLDPALAPKSQDWLDMLQPSGYSGSEYGYCRLDDGSWYISVYTVYPGITPAMLGWFFRWLNVRPKGMPEKQGNLKYKIWHPADHFDHGFVNGENPSDGSFSVESYDLGRGQPMTHMVSHSIDPQEFGLTEDRQRALKEAGCAFNCKFETFHPVESPEERLGGTHLYLNLSRMSPYGYVEKITREWIGWTAKDGEIVRDETTPDSMLSEEYLRNVIVHSTVEGQHLAKFLPALYAEYKDQPADAD